MSDFTISPLRVVTDPIEQGVKKIGGGDKEDFGDLLKNAIQNVEDLQFEAGEAQNKLVAGEAAELHQVMIAAEKAGLSFDLLLEIRKRLLDAYQELIRMPI
jgi:flagellar hook-basal body complex protein FliE